MKKTLKKLLAIVVAVLMVFTSALPALAEDSYTITITNGSKLPDMENGQFRAYQVFTGEIHKTEGAPNQLKNVEWGSDVNSASLLADLKAATKTPLGDKFAAATTAADVAYVLEKYNGTAGHDFLQAFSAIVKANLKTGANVGTPSTASADKKSSTITVNSAGYYFIDEPNVPSVGDGQNKVQSEFILQVLGRDTVVPIKADIPKVDKKIVEDNGAEVKGTTAQVGEVVTFKLTGTLPADLAVYKVYKYVFHDTMSAALTNATAKSIEIQDKNGATKLAIAAADFSKYFTASGSNVSVKFDNLFKLVANLDATDKIIVTYTATVASANLVLGNPDGDEKNNNQVYVEYSNDPTQYATGTPGSGPGGDPDPGEDPDPSEEPKTGESTKDTVYVYSFGLDLKKVGNDADHKNGLEGAGFLLKNDKGEYAKFDVANGVYTFNSWVAQAAATTVTSAKDTGLIQIRGIDAGTYTLTETVIPDHYLKTADVTITITASIDDNGDLKSVTFNGTEYKDFKDDAANAGKTGVFKSGIYALTIENKRIPILPSTGGIGNTIFYVVGGILVIAAAGCLIITSKRKKSAQQ